MGSVVGPLVGAVVGVKVGVKVGAKLGDAGSGGMAVGPLAMGVTGWDAGPAGVSVSTPSTSCTQPARTKIALIRPVAQKMRFRFN